MTGFTELQLDAIFVFVAILSFGLGLGAAQCRPKDNATIQQNQNIAPQGSVITDYFVIDYTYQDVRPWKIYSLDRIVNRKKDWIVYSCVTKQEALALASALNSREAIRLSRLAGETR